jgi:CRP-like cAMP-binding protein
MEGDQLDISGCFGSEANCDVQALTSVEYAEVARQSIRAMARDRPQVGMALWRLTARNAAILGEWLTNVGRRNARGRVSHLMCEIAARQHELGTIGDGDCSMPLTQEQIGDSTGLTAVHVNRVIRSLRHDHLIECDNRRLRIVDWEGLKRAGDFQPEYLQSECVD